jgi:hypothetical protein
MSGRVLALELIRDIAPPSAAEERIAIAQRVIDDPGAFDEVYADALTMILCTARLCERDPSAQRAELQAIVRLDETHSNMAEARHRLPGLKRPVGDSVQDHWLAQLLDEQQGV